MVRIDIISTMRQLFTGPSRAQQRILGQDSCQELAKNLPRTCQELAKNLPRTCQELAKNLPRTCQELAQDAKIMPAKFSPRSCQELAQDLVQDDPKI